MPRPAILFEPKFFSGLRLQVSKAGPRRHASSWSREETGLRFRCNGTALMDILIVTFKFILAMEAVLSAILATDNVAWKRRGFGAVFGTIVTLQVTPLLEGSGTFFLGASVFILMEIMRSLVGNEVIWLK